MREIGVLDNDKRILITLLQDNLYSIAHTDFFICILTRDPLRR